MSRGAESSIVTKCAQVLDVLSDVRKPLTFAEIVAETGFVKSSCHRILAVLQSEEMVEYDKATRTYRIGLRMKKWQRSAWHRADLQTAAGGELTALSEMTEMNAALSIVDGDTLLYLLTAGTQTVRYAAHAGDHAPLHCTAAGKVLLAHLPNGRQAKLLSGLKLEKYTEFTKTRLEDLTPEFCDILERGYAVGVKEEFLHVMGVAAPIRDIQNQVVASLSIWTLTTGRSEADLFVHIPELTAAAARISGLIGWLPRVAERKGKWH